MSLQPIRRTSRVDSIPLGLARIGTGDLKPSQPHESNNAVGDIHAAGQAQIHIGTNISTYLQNPYDEPIRLFQTWLNDEDNVDCVFELAGALGGSNPEEEDSIEHSNRKLKHQNERLEALFSYMSLQDGQGNTSRPSLAKFQQDASAQQQASLETLLERWRPAEISESDSPSLQKSAVKRMQLLLTSKKKEYEVEMRHNIFKWLVPQSMTDKMFEESLQTRLQGTCDWVFQLEAFEDWSSTIEGDHETAKILWINGIAGSGKTVLCAKIVEHLKANLKTPVGYFFLADSIGFTDPFMALRIWLFHILSDQDAFDIIRRTWREQRDKIPTQGVIRDLFEKVVQHVPGCTFILDGLDECGPSNESSLNTKTSIVDQFLQSLWPAVDGTTTRILMTSRKDSDIQQNFNTQPDIEWFEHEMTGQDVGGDINAYATSIVERLLTKKSQKLKDEIIQQMIERCDGQILWLRLLELALGSGGKEPARIKAIISQTPSKLRDLYQRNWKAMQCLEPYDSARAINLLRWVAFAIRPLTVGEVIEALAIDDDDIQDFPLDYMPDEIDQDVVNGLVSICNGLIEVSPANSDQQCQNWILQFPHYSIKEYILGQFNRSSSLPFFDKKAAAETEEEQNMYLAIACLRYISFPSVWPEDGLETSPSELELGQMFREYASTYWYQHIKPKQRNDSALIKIVNDFFAVSNSTWENWENWFSKHEQLLMYNEEAESGSRIHYACHLGLLETVRYLLQHQPESVRSKTSSGKTGLLLACKQGHAEIADLLMSCEADIEACSINGCTSLYFASRNNHITVVQNLIAHGASSTKANKWGHTPFLAACLRGHKDIVMFLIASNADPTVPTKKGWTALNVAVAEGHTSIVPLLLEQTVDIHAASIEGRTPLHNASLRGNDEIVRLLLEFGAKPQMICKRGWTPLMVASSTGHLAVTRLLLKHGADVNSRNKDNFEALYLASRNGYKDIAQCLLEKGADPNAVQDKGWRPIHASSEFGHLQVTRLLQAHGADIHARCEDGMTVLHLAALKGHVEVVRFLIEQGADTNAKDNDGWQPIHAASEFGHLEVARLLKDHGASVHAQSKTNRRTPLFLAALKGQAEIVDFLIKEGADINAKESKGWQPIHTSSEFGHLEVTHILHDHGADVHARGEAGTTPLHLAALRGQTDVIRFLIQQGASVNTTDSDGCQAIHGSSKNGHVEVTRLLLDQGTDIEARSAIGGIPLYVAALGGHVDVARLLIQRGANVNTADKIGWIPIHGACKRGHLDMVKVLIEHGAILGAPNNEGIVSMLCAVANGHIDVARFLMEKGVDLRTSM